MHPSRLNKYDPKQRGGGGMLTLEWGKNGAEVGCEERVMLVKKEADVKGEDL